MDRPDLERMSRDELIELVLRNYSRPDLINFIDPARFGIG
jgi:hypothetical protein